MLNIKDIKFYDTVKDIKTGKKGFIQGDITETCSLAKLNNVNFIISEKHYRPNDINMFNFTRFTFKTKAENIRRCRLLLIEKFPKEIEKQWH